MAKARRIETAAIILVEKMMLFGFGTITDVTRKIPKESTPNE